MQYKSSSRTRALTRLFKELFRQHPHATCFDIMVTINSKESKYFLVKDIDKNWVVSEEKDDLERIS